MSISPVVRRALRFQDLLAIPGGDGPYLFTSMFRERDARERRRSRRQFRLLKRVDGTIREIVDSSETVLFLTEGRGFSYWERWAVGWRRAVVLTDRRAIFLELDAARRPRVLHRHLPYSAISGIQEGRWGRIEVRTADGEILELRGIRRADRPDLIEGLRRGARTNRGDPASPGIEQLCPYCHRGVQGRPRSCPTCLRRFGRAWLSGIYSLMVPGLGNFLRGYRGFAVLELSMAVAIWAAYLLGAPAWGLPRLAGYVGPEWVFAAVHGADAIVTWYLARDEVFP
ncbi:MAG: hypothetical protein ACLFWG_12015 [Longimicrobiales bacterium]